MLAVSASAVAASESVRVGAADAGTMSATPSIRVRPSNARGKADHGWLKSYHTFSFADYYDPKFESFGALRVINEDTVAGGEGFGTHPHRDAEIFSYVISGVIEHKDSMGNTELLTRGQVQFTSAGTGIRHSEFNGDKKLPLRFLQIWAMPRQRGLTPRYETKTFGDEAKADKLCPIITPDGSNGTITIAQDFRMFASILSSGVSLRHALGSRRAYLHVPIMDGSGGVTLSGSGAAAVTLKPGDGAFVEGVSELEIVGADGKKPTEFVLFDLV